MSKPRIAVVSFPGNNCEVESIRSINQNGMEAVFFRWNDDPSKLENIDGYFIPGGFSYEDRGRAGMVAARDPLLQHIAEEASAGKVVIGNCNGAQILVESGLIPLDRGLRMSLARNVVDDTAVGFLNEWIWMTPTCKRDRCATSDWEGVMHIPLAHGEGRFTTKDKDVIEELKRNDQIAFSYCDESGSVSSDSDVTPNGSDFAIAGICNPAGNIVALMPHPERSLNGDPYFMSMRKWIQSEKSVLQPMVSEKSSTWIVPDRKTWDTEIFIDTIIANNEERTVEQTLRKHLSSVHLKQFRYVALQSDDAKKLLQNISHFNPNKEVAYIRRNGQMYAWNNDTRTEEKCESSVLKGFALLRRDDPDTGATALGKGSETGTCYAFKDIDEQKLYSREVLEILANPHASTLEKLVV